MAHLVPTLFWNRTRHELDKIKPVFMLAESENHDLLEYAFDSIYNWKLLHAMNELAARTINASEFFNIALNEVKYLPVGAFYLNFTSNHDENSWQGSAIERLHYYLEPLTVLKFMIQGLPLIYSGQEAGNYRQLEFFDKDEIEWKADKMFSLYKNLIELRKRNTELWSEGVLSKIDNDTENQIISFMIESLKVNKSVIVFLNLSDQDISFYIKCGYYKDHLKSVTTKENYKLNCNNTINLKAYSYLLLESV